MSYLALGLTGQLVMDVVVYIWVFVLDRVLVEAALLVLMKNMDRISVYKETNALNASGWEHIPTVSL